MTSRVAAPEDHDLTPVTWRITLVHFLFFKLNLGYFVAIKKVFNSVETYLMPHDGV